MRFELADEHTVTDDTGMGFDDRAARVDALLAEFLPLGYLLNDDGVTADWLAGGGFEIEIAGRRVAAKASLTAMYDPKGERIRG